MRMVNEFDQPSKSFRGQARPHRRPGAKRAVNLSVDAGILAAAKAQGINLSAALENELRRLTNEERIKRFQEEHREAFESYNRFIEDHGIWSEKYRSGGKR
jgi:antitoxin CcdA